MDLADARARGWVYFDMKERSKAEAVAEQISALFPQGGDDWVVIRADVTTDHQVVVALDARVSSWDKAVQQVQAAAKASPTRVAQVGRHYPAVPHRAHCFVTKAEFDQWKLPEFDPPGRHPKSPGANPWG